VNSQAGKAESFRLLTRGDVRAALDRVDPVAVIEAALRAHADGRSLLPAEAYLTWQNSQNSYCRSLAMPGGLLDSDRPVLGVKVINAAVSNPDLGVPRAGGFCTLFDFETGRPSVLAEGALISALRTACYTMSSLRHLGPAIFDRVALLGCGNLAQMHVDLLRRYFPAVTHLDLFDTRSTVAESLAERWSSAGDGTAQVHSDTRAALRSAPVVITLTTSSQPYIARDWLADRVFVAHASLDDLLPEVLASAAAIFVDDLDLVRDNPRRVLGRLLQEGVLADHAAAGRPGLTGTLGQVLTGRLEPVRPSAGCVVSNPFGMSILDLALLREVEAVALRDDLGVFIDLTVAEPAAAMLGRAVAR
jgi:N-[(2S)-2-amino-2-carboxyethyl]-L-glutamate dehydrogenase